VVVLDTPAGAQYAAPVNLGPVARRAASVCALVLAGGFSSAAHAATESTTFQVDAGHSGYLYGAGVVPPLTLSWSRTLHWHNDTVAIDGGRVFAFSKSPETGLLLVDGVNLSTGGVAWIHSTGVTSPTYQELTVDGGRVYAAVAASQSGYAYIELSAYDENTGTLLWTDELTDQAFPTWIVTANGTLYMQGYGVGGTVYAIDEIHGVKLWSTDLLEGNPVTLAGNVVVIPGVCGLSYGLSRTTGAIIWSDQPGCDGGGIEMASFDGTDVWGDDWASPPNRVYNPTNGQIVNRYSGFAPAFGYSEAVQAVYNSTTATFQIHAFVPATLATRWTFTEPGTNFGSDPLLADGYVFAEGGNNTVWALRPCSGTIAWQASTGVSVVPFGGEPLLSLAAGDGYLVVPTGTGLVAFKGSGMPAANPPVCTGGG
jgi:hypothetical protein